ncbi:hypothetical protein [Sphingobium baderi]|uniref:hypothetical protein n=1 Tax=Sphingobium baderi TaxID=1332080 RepID=UPI002B40912F|nr:hypothetical protein [Sphingobium baderi]WRD77920.1 hypothetical protein QQ987_07425 [Sphingobium baderi]
MLDIARNAYEDFPRQSSAIEQRTLDLVLSNARYANGEIPFQFGDHLIGKFSGEKREWFDLG